MNRRKLILVCAAIVVALSALGAVFSYIWWNRTVATGLGVFAVTYGTILVGLSRHQAWKD